MAWSEKYRQEIADIRLITWTTKISKDGFAGELTYFKGSGEPIILELCNESDDPYDPIKESRAVISVIAETGFILDDLYSTEDMQFKVEIYQNSDLYWVGYVDTQQGQEPYEDVPYTVEIYCTDGLSLLRNILYNDEGTYYNGRILTSQIILDILGKIGFTAFKEYVNIYEEAMDDAVGDSLYDQSKPDVDIFRDMYCDEVFKELFKPFGTCIRQVDGIFQIYRPKELIGATVYGRYFTGAAIKSAISFTPKQYIDRNGYSSNIRQVPGGIKGWQSPAKKIIINQDYGNKKSWIKNWQFNLDSWASGDFTDWTKYGTGTAVYPISSLLPNERYGMFHAVYHTDAQPGTLYLEATFGDNAVENVGDLFGIEFDLLIYNNGAATASNVSFWMMITDGTNYLAFDHYIGAEGSSKAAWTSGAADYIYILQDAPVGSSGWQNIKRTFEDLPSAGPFTIRIYALDNAFVGINVAIKDIKFVAYSATYPKSMNKLRMIDPRRHRPSTLTHKPIEIIEEIEDIFENIYEKTNAINGVNLDYDMIIGDVVNTDMANILEQFAGALAVSIRDTLAEAAADFVTDHAADYTDIDVTSDEEDIIFTGKETATKVSGDDFTGDTSITNTSGNLDGSVVATQAYVTSVPQIDTITVTGDSGEADVLCDGVTKALEWEISIALTLQNFVDDYADDYLAVGTILTCTVDELIFTAKKAGVPFTGATSITNVSGTLDGEVEDPPTQANVVGQVRIDTITLSGYEGTADIVCDAEEQEVDIDETLSSSSDWNTRGGSESKPLLEIICDEIALQYSRPKELIDMALMETEDSEKTTLNLLGNFQDALNTYNNYFRAFVANRGTFDVRNRQWQLDLVEIGEGEEVAAEYPAILDDGHHWWYDATDLETITKDGSNFVSAWDSKLISHPLPQETGSNQPLWQSPGTILFDGIDNFLRTVAFTWDQPNKIYFIGKQIGWTQGDVIYEGITTYYGGLRQYNHSPRVRLSYPPGFYTVQNDDWILDIYAIVRTLNYSTDSYIQINDDAPVVADNKAYNMGGFTLGRAGSSSIGYGNFVVADIICADIVDTEENETAIYDFLVSRIPA